MADTEFVTFLRELADFYESRPLVPEPLWFSGDIYVYLHGDGQKEVLKSLGGFDKDYFDTYFLARKEIGGRTLVFHADREAVCVAKVVGKKHVESYVIPAKFEPEQVVEAHDEDVVEWDCTPVLAPKPELVKP